MSKILIVDDSETLRTQLRGLLESKSYEVVEGFDGVNGLEVLKQNPDTKLIFCDVNMPNMDGITMCSKVAEDSSLNSIPILMLTTESNADMKEKGKKAGVKAWIVKPYNEDKLLLAVAKLLSM